MEDAVSRAVRVLNEALERDGEAVTRLVNSRVPCNAKLASHPTVATGRATDGSDRLGILGLLNGILADLPGAVIGAEGSQAAEGGFVRVRRFVDLRGDKTDLIA